MRVFQSPSRQRRQRMINIKKQAGGKCVFCGYDKNYAALDFHHIDPSKKLFGINTATKGTRDKLMAEIEKCVLLCRNCHSELHHPKMNSDKWPDAPIEHALYPLKPSDMPVKRKAIEFNTPEWFKLLKDLAKEMDAHDYVRPEWLPEDVMNDFLNDQIPRRAIRSKKARTVWRKLSGGLYRQKRIPATLTAAHTHE